MNQNMQKLRAAGKLVNAGFIKGLVVKMLVGEKRDISPTSALRLRVGRLIWGRSTGLAMAGKSVVLPDEIFYEISDRALPGFDAVKSTVMHNLVRAQMYQLEARVLKAAMMVLFLASAGAGVAVVFGTQIVENFHFSKISRSEPGISESDARLMQSDARTACSYSKSPSEACANYVIDTCKGQFSQFKVDKGDAYIAVQPKCFVSAASDYAATH